MAQKVTVMQKMLCRSGMQIMQKVIQKTAFLHKSKLCKCLMDNKMEILCRFLYRNAIFLHKVSAYLKRLSVTVYSVKSLCRKSLPPTGVSRLSAAAYPSGALAGRFFFQKMGEE